MQQQVESRGQQFVSMEWQQLMLTKEVVAFHPCIFTNTLFICGMQLVSNVLRKTHPHQKQLLPMQEQIEFMEKTIHVKWSNHDWTTQKKLLPLWEKIFANARTNGIHGENKLCNWFKEDSATQKKLLKWFNNNWPM